MRVGITDIVIALKRGALEFLNCEAAPKLLLKLHRVFSFNSHNDLINLNPILQTRNGGSERLRTMQSYTAEKQWSWAPALISVTRMGCRESPESP